MNENIDPTLSQQKIEASKHERSMIPDLGEVASDLQIVELEGQPQIDESLLSELRRSFVSGYRDGYRGWRRNLRDRVSS